jgi:hypothetical protein
MHAYGDIQVQNRETTEADGFRKTRLRLVRNGEEREVMHFHYHTWPDKVPELPRLVGLSTPGIASTAVAPGRPDAGRQAFYQECGENA